MKQFDPTLPRRMFWANELAISDQCPGCHCHLESETQAYLLKIGGEQFVTGNDYGAFCPDCPIVVIDQQPLLKMAEQVYGSSDLAIAGIVDLEDPSEGQSELEGDVPIHLTPFLSPQEHYEIKRILHGLEYYHGTLPEQALRQAIKHQERITPFLLKAIKEAKEDIEHLDDDPDYMLYTYVFYLLAQFREMRAYPLIVDFFSVPGEISLDVTGDFVTEDLSKVLAAVCHGDLSGITSLIQNENANEFVRSAAIGAIVCLVANDEMDRVDAIDYLRDLFQTLPRKYDSIWSFLICDCLDIYPEELFSEIKQAFDDKLVEEFAVGIEDVERTLQRGREESLNRLKTDRHYQYVKDVVDEIGWWACWQKEKPKLKAIQQKKKNKTGRNDPCPCDSGKKYKKCCGGAIPAMPKV